MEYQISDSGAETDDDHPPSNQNRVLRGSSSAGNARSASTSVQDAVIHQAEKEAYSSVLRAFKYQSNDLSWDKKDLMSDLRKELKISDDEHSELLRAVNTDETIQSIRKGRETSCYQPAGCSISQPVHEDLPSPTVSASRKKRKTSNSHQPLPDLPSVKSVQHPSARPARRKHFTDPSLYSALPSKLPAQAEESDPLIGKKAFIRWPPDNQFFEVSITNYNPAEGRHALVYDYDKANETYEWVDLKQIPPEDIVWKGEDPGIPLRGGHSDQGRRSGRKGAERKVRFNLQATEEFPSQQNVTGNRVLDDIVLLKTDVLLKEVEDIYAVSSPGSLELELALKKLKKHEQALVTAIATIDMHEDEMLEDAYNRESDWR